MIDPDSELIVADDPDLLLQLQKEAANNGRNPGATGKREQKTQATKLFELARASGMDLFHTPERKPFASIPVGGHTETLEVRSRPFRDWLSYLYWQQEEAMPSAQAVQDALGLISGTAIYEGQEHEVYVRLAEVDSTIYLDLGNPEWEAVKVTRSGWKVIQEPPVKFRRSGGLAALPTPARGGSLEELRRHLNIDDRSWPLIAGWLIAAARPRGPYPPLVLLGGQGRAKSTTARQLRQLIDPATSGLRAEPREIRDLMIAAKNSHVVAFDNLSRVPDWLSDALCRLATGGGFSTRELYSDSDEIIFEATRPTILTSISEIATRSDLLDRSLLTYLPEIKDTTRKPEEKLWADFEKARPKLLGALLDAVVTAMTRLPEVNLQKLPRMADFAEWVTAAEPALGLGGQAFIESYRINRDEASALALESSVVALTITRMMETQAKWEGTASELLSELEEPKWTSEQMRRSKDWPKSPQVLSRRLREIAGNLDGITAVWEREGKGRKIVLERVG